MTEHRPDEVKASPSGMYEYLLGGTANTPADRRSVDALLESLPEIRDGAEANRGFLRRAVRHLAGNGISQFIDLGSGPPAQNNTDEVARRINPNARMVFVDLNPLVLEHVNRLEGDTVRAVRADIRRADEVLADPAMDYFVTDENDPFGIVRNYMDALPSGSYLALPHLNGEGRPEKAVRKIREAWAGAAPGIVNVGEWGADDPALKDSEGSRWAVCAVARKP